MPILGAIASSISGNLGAYESIQTVSYPSGTGNAATFSNIPAKYRNLQIRMLTRDTTAAVNTLLFINFNGTTAVNIGAIGVQINGSTPSAWTEGNSSYIRTLNAGANAGSNRFAHSIVTIFDSNQTNKYKSGSVLNGYTDNSSTTGRMYIHGFNWQSQNAITSITVTPNTAFAQYTHLALYGMV